MKKMKAGIIAAMTIACISATTVSAISSRAEHINQIKRNVLFMDDVTDKNANVLDICKEKQEILSESTGVTTDASDKTEPITTEEPVQPSNPKDGLDIVMDSGYGSGIVRLDNSNYGTTYGLYIDNWSFCAAKFPMPTPDMKWYNETQDAITQAKAYGEDEMEAFLSGASYYVTRMTYNENLDVMYEDGIVWVYSPTEDGYRSSWATIYNHSLLS